MLETPLSLIGYFSNLQKQLVLVTNERIYKKIYWGKTARLRPYYDHSVNHSPNLSFRTFQSWPARMPRTSLAQYLVGKYLEHTYLLNTAVSTDNNVRGCFNMEKFSSPHILIWSLNYCFVQTMYLTKFHFFIKMFFQFFLEGIVTTTY